MVTSCAYIFTCENQFFCNELRIERLAFIARFAIHSNLVKSWVNACVRNMGREGEEIHTWNETQMEKSMGKDGYGGKAGKGRREKGNGGKIVDQYLNS